MKRLFVFENTIPGAANSPFLYIPGVNSLPGFANSLTGISISSGNHLGVVP